MNEQTKECPFCAETIKVAAIVCRFCNRDLGDANSSLSKDQSSLRNCPDCGGCGEVRRNCYGCRGTGHVQCELCGGDREILIGGISGSLVRCNVCHGSGQTRCDDCNGSGNDTEGCSTCSGCGQVTVLEFDNLKREKEEQAQKRDVEQQQRQIEQEKRLAEEEKRKAEEQARWLAEEPKRRLEQERLRAEADQQREADQRQKAEAQRQQEIQRNKAESKSAVLSFLPIPIVIFLIIIGVAVYKMTPTRNQPGTPSSANTKPQMPAPATKIVRVNMQGTWHGTWHGNPTTMTISGRSMGSGTVSTVIAAPILEHWIMA